MATDGTRTTGEDSTGRDGAAGAAGETERSQLAAAAAAATATAATAARCFKLRFAAPREPGRSALSAVRPLGLPAPVTDKLYTRGGADDEAAAERALARVRERFALGPRDKYPYPVTTSHEYVYTQSLRYGWHVGAGGGVGVGGEAGARGVRGAHHIRDSAWLRARLRLLAHDAAFKRH